MKKTSKIFYSLIVVTLMVFNFQFVFQNQGNVNLDFFGITSALAFEGDPPPPKGTTCKEDVCHESIGVDPFKIIYDGHYKHCGNADSGTCVSANCDRPCDAGPV